MSLSDVTFSKPSLVICRRTLQQSLRRLVSGSLADLLITWNGRHLLKCYTQHSFSIWSDNMGLHNFLSFLVRFIPLFFFSISLFRKTFMPSFRLSLLPSIFSKCSYLCIYARNINSPFRILTMSVLFEDVWNVDVFSKIETVYGILSIILLNTISVVSWIYVIFNENNQHSLLYRRI